MRGGIFKRYSKSSDDKTIIYLDMNNLYGTVMSFRGFKFLSQKEIKVFNLDRVGENSVTGYILEVDLEYCWNLHHLHNDFPLCPEKIGVRYDMLRK